MRLAATLRAMWASAGRLLWGTRPFASATARRRSHTLPPPQRSGKEAAEEFHDPCEPLIDALRRWLSSRGVRVRVNQRDRQQLSGLEALSHVVPLAICVTEALPVTAGR